MQASPQQRLYDAACQRRGLGPLGLPQEDGSASPQEATSPSEAAAKGLAGQPLAIAGAATKQSCLLGRTLIGEKAIGTTLKVKNTFIDSVSWDDEEDFGPPMTAIKSCPVKATQEEGLRPWWEELKTEQQALPCEDSSCWPSVVPEVGSSPGSSPVRGSAHQAAATMQEACWQGLQGEVQLSQGVQQHFQQGSDGSVLWPIFVMQAPAPQVQQPARLPSPPEKQQPAAQPARQQPASSHVVPLEVRGPESSAGSALHGTGDCRPCAWFWRPQGCANGRDCQHCHLCPMNEAKERKRLKRATLTVRVDLPASSCYAEEAFARAAAWLPPPPGL